MAGSVGWIELRTAGLLPWAAALHAIALPAAAGVAVARVRATVPPPARWVPIVAVAGAAGATALAAAIRARSPEAAALLAQAFAPLLVGEAILLALALGLSAVARPWPARATAAALLAAVALGAPPLSFMTTPGAWPASRALEDAVLNPTLPALLLARAAAVAAFCGVVLLASASRAGAGLRGRAGRAGALLSVAGAATGGAAAWFGLRTVGTEAAARALGDVALPAAAAQVAAWALPAFAAFALLFAWLLAPRPAALRHPSATLLALLAAAAVGGAEVARVGLSGPWIVGAPGDGWLLANGLTAGEQADARRDGLASVRPAVGPAAGSASAARGGRVYAVACAPCHAEEALRDRLAGWPPAAIEAAIARLDRLSAASPPFPGTGADRRDLARFLAGSDGSPRATLPPPDPLRIAEGKRLFDAGCLHCHREIPLEARIAGWPEPLAWLVTGRLGAMNPAMAHLHPSEAERRALAAYLVTLGARAPSGARR